MLLQEVRQTCAYGVGAPLFVLGSKLLLSISENVISQAKTQKLSDSATEHGIIFKVL